MGLPRSVFLDGSGLSKQSLWICCSARRAWLFHVTWYELNRQNEEANGSVYVVLCCVERGPEYVMALTAVGKILASKWIVNSELLELQVTWQVVKSLFKPGSLVDLDSAPDTIDVIWGKVINVYNLHLVSLLIKEKTICIYKVLSIKSNIFRGLRTVLNAQEDEHMLSSVVFSCYFPFGWDLVRLPFSHHLIFEPAPSIPQRATIIGKLQFKAITATFWRSTCLPPVWWEMTPLSLFEMQTV